jgi:hypothetical protein
MGLHYSSQFQPPCSSEIENCITQHRSILVMPNHCLKLLNIRNVTDKPGIVEKAVCLLTAPNLKCPFLGTLVYFDKNIPVS